MGRVASNLDNALIESFWSTMQRELLDRQHWNSRVELTSAIFEWIEGWYNPRRRHSHLDWTTPREFEKQHTTLSPVSSLASP
jgi:transposase InsO family protein